MTILAAMFQEDKIARTELYGKRDELAKEQGLMVRAPTNCIQNKRVRSRPTLAQKPKATAKTRGTLPKQEDAVEMEENKEEDGVEYIEEEVEEFFVKFKNL